MQPGIADQIFFNDIRRHHQVADVLGNHHQRSGQNGEDSKPFKARGVERRQGKPVRLGDRRSVDNAHHERERVADQHADQNRDNGHKTAKQHRTEDRHRQRHHRNNDGFAVRRLSVSRQQASHIGSDARQFEADNRDNGPHSRRREHHVQPAGAGFFDNKGDDAEQSAAHNEATQRHLIPQRQQQQHRGYKCEARSEIGRDFSLTDEKIQQCPNAVKQQDGSRVDMKQNGHQNRCAKHSEQMLQTQWDSL